MNVLLDPFPVELDVAGESAAIDADFRTAIRILLAFDDPELAEAEKRAVACGLLYERLPGDRAEAYRQLVWFLNRGRDAEAQGAKGGGAPYSWEHDAPYIYTAIRQTYGVDLETTPFLHWWKFLNMFLDLGECFFSRILYYRAQRKAGKLTPEERRAVAGMRDVIDIPTRLTAGEQAELDEFERALDGEKEPV